MWVEDQSGSLFNLDFVTSIEPTVTTSTYPRENQKWAIVAHRLGPSHDVVLLAHLTEEQAYSVIGRIRHVLKTTGAFLDISALAKEDVIVDLRQPAERA